MLRAVERQLRLIHIHMTIGEGMTYLEYISGKAFRLIHNKHDAVLNDHFLSPLGIDTPYTYKDIDAQIKRLINLYHDGREVRQKYSDNLILDDLLHHYFFERDQIVCEFRSTNVLINYYQVTKEVAAKIQNASNFVKQNRLYEIVIRNLLIIGENIISCRGPIDLYTIDISVNAVEYLCRGQLRDLFKFEEYEYQLHGANEKAEFVKNHGGFPFQFTQYVDDPEKKSQLKYWFTGIPQIKQDVEIHLYDCNFAHLFYALFLTALVEKVEAMC